MKKLIYLLQLLQNTRHQPQYGYNISGITKQEMSDLAQHHYLVTFIAWQLCRKVNNTGGKINTERVLEICMVHDLGELFGGDINSFYAKANPVARKLAKEFEYENNKFLSKFFEDDSAYYLELIDEMQELKTEESILAKVADYIEVLNFKQRLNRLVGEDLDFANSIKQIASKLSNENNKTSIMLFLEEWTEQLNNGTQPAKLFI